MIKNFNLFLNESNTADNFKTKLGHRSVNLYSKPVKGDQYLDPLDMTIEWKTNIQETKHGISSFTVEILNVHGYYTMTTPTEDEDLQDEIEFKTDKEWEFETEINNFEFGGTIEPQEIDIDFKTKKIKVVF